MPTTASKSTEETAAEAEEKQPNRDAPTTKSSGSTAKKKSTAKIRKTKAPETAEPAEPEASTSAAPKKTGGRKKAPDAVDEILAEVDEASPTEALENAVAKAEDEGEDAADLVTAKSGALEDDESGSGLAGFVISNADDDDAPAVQVVSPAPPPIP